MRETNRGLSAYYMFFAVTFIQFGYGVYFSFPFLAVCILFYVVNRARLSYLFSLPVIFCLASIALYLLRFHEYSNFVPLRDIRFSVFLSVLMFLQRCNFKDDFALRFQNLPWCRLYLVIVALTVAQAQALKFGLNLYMPTFLFITPGDKALGAGIYDFLVEHGLSLDLRPSAFYSEPSYLGLMVLFLHTLILLFRSYRVGLLFSATSILFSAYVGTGFGIVANLIMAFHFHVRNPLLKLSIVSALAAVLLTASLAGLLPERLDRIVAGQDESLAVRLTRPLPIIADVLVNSPFGFPLSGAVDHYVSEGLLVAGEDQPFQNGFFNFIIAYGWASPILLLIIASGGRSATGALFLLLSLFQNGAYSEIDKIALNALISLSCAYRLRLALSQGNPPRE